MSNGVAAEEMFSLQISFPRPASHCCALQKKKKKKPRQLPVHFYYFLIDINPVYMQSMKCY